MGSGGSKDVLHEAANKSLDISHYLTPEQYSRVSILFEKYYLAYSLLLFFKCLWLGYFINKILYFLVF